MQAEGCRFDPDRFHHNQGTGPVARRTGGDRWMRIRGRVLDANPLCAHCLDEGMTVAATEIDHIIPLAQGGTDDMSNLQGLCHAHHVSKTRTETQGRHGRIIGCDAEGNPLAWSAPR